MTTLQLRLFGKFHAAAGESPIDDFPTDKVRALLAYLAAEANRSHARTHLATLLWSEWDEAAARANLRKSLFRLRQTLEKALPDSAASLLTVTRNAVQFHSAGADVDLLRFERLGQSDDATDLAEAADLYMGELLAGLAVSGAPVFEEWLTVRRERAHGQALAVLNKVAEHCLAQSNYEAALAAAARQLVLEPWHETAHRQLMRTYIAAGQRVQALAQYEQCRRSLVEEMGVEPSVETEQLVVAIRQDRPIAIRMHHFPPPTIAFVGREQDIEHVLGRINDPQTRLITITGTGGIGKTRLATEAARSCVAQYGAANAYFIPLAAVTAERGLWQAIGEQLGVQPGEQGLADSDVLSYLAERSALLVLDNYEQLLPHTRCIEQILEHAPEARLLVTSRVPLNLRAEWRLPLAGLPLPPQDCAAAGLSLYPAVQLLQTAAQKIMPAFQVDESNAEAVNAICHSLAGMPLALEIAASWLQLYTPQQLADQIATGVDSLTAMRRDVPERHRSLRVIFEHSWSSLRVPARTVFSQLTCFSDNFTLDAALAATAATPGDIGVLLDHALLQRLDNGRFSLHPVLRQFAHERLRDKTAVSDKHAAWYLRQVADVTPQLRGSAANSAITAVRADLDNIRQAWQWATARRYDELLAVALEGLAAYHEFRGTYEEGSRQFAAAADVLPASALVNRLRLAEARCLQILGELARAIALTQRVVQSQVAETQLHALIRLGKLYERTSNYDLASSTLTEALALADESSIEAAQIWNILGIIGRYRGATDDSIAAHQRALAISNLLQDELETAESHANLSLIYKDIASYDDAIGHIERALAIAERLDHRERIGGFTHSLGVLYWQQDKLEKARTCWMRSLEIAEELNHKRIITICCNGLGVIARRNYEYDEALRYLQQALRLASELGDKSLRAIMLGIIGMVYWDTGQYEQAIDNLQQAAAIDRSTGAISGVGRHLGNIGDTLKSQHRYAEALSYFEEAIPLFRQSAAQYYLCWVLVSYAECLFELGRLEEARVANEEGERMAAEIGRQLYVLHGGLLAARMLAADGALQQARALLQQLQTENDGADAQSEIAYTLWQITGEDEPRKIAIDHLTTLYADTGIDRYQVRRQTLIAAGSESQRASNPLADSGGDD